MVYRTKTYIAADWNGDADAIQQLNTWKNGEKWNLSYIDAHDITNAKDSSLNCSIKKSLSKRFDVSKNFILIVGNGTKTRRAGECTYCANYVYKMCQKDLYIYNQSYIEYECKKAIRDSLNIVVLYNSAIVDKSKCPDIIRNYGTHAVMQKIIDGKRYWNYESVKQALQI